VECDESMKLTPACFWSSTIVFVLRKSCGWWRS